MRRNSILTIIIPILIILMSTFANAGSVQLPQTGQTSCYDSAGVVINCADTGQDGGIRAGVPWPNPRFTIGTGAESDCITDNLTGLMWPRNGNLTNGYRNWYVAIDFANELTLCGHNDWRLPNVIELESLVNTGKWMTTSWLHEQGFYDVQTGSYWTSTSVASRTSTGAWVIALWSGETDDGNKDASWFISVLPVRSE